MPRSKLSGGRGFFKNDLDDIRKRYLDEFPTVAKKDRALFDQLVHSNYNKNRSILRKGKFRALEAKLRAIARRREEELMYLHTQSVVRSRMRRTPSAPSFLLNERPSYHY